MAKIKIPESLPQCKLLELLVYKSDQRKDTDFDYLGRLRDFQQRVSGEVRQINALFLTELNALVTSYWIIPQAVLHVDKIRGWYCLRKGNVSGFT